LYPSREEKASVLLYFIIKNQPFVDGNKRIGCMLFACLLAKNEMLDTTELSNKALAYLAILVDESAASDKDKVIKLIMEDYLNE
jgi:prophage maintenance system killer protein